MLPWMEMSLSNADETASGFSFIESKMSLHQHTLFLLMDKDLRTFLFSDVIPNLTLATLITLKLHKTSLTGASQN